MLRTRKTVDPAALPPRRYFALSRAQQRGLALEYAIAVAERRAGGCGDPHYHGPYREMIVAWEHPLSPSGRWKVPQRFLSTAARARAWAEAIAAERPPASISDPVFGCGQAIAIWLRRLERRHRRTSRSPVATEIDIPWKRRAELRALVSPRRPYLARSLAAQQRRRAEREYRESLVVRLDWLAIER